MRYYEFAHSLGIHVWEIPALIAVLLMIAVCLIHWRNQRKRERVFGKELEKRGLELREGSSAAAGREGGL